MANEIWVQRMEAIRSLVDSYGYVDSLARAIKENWDKSEDSVPDRYEGYAVSLAKYFRLLQSLWSVLYDINERNAAAEAEQPKLLLPPHIKLSDTNVPYTTDPALGQGFEYVDNEAPVAAADSQTPGMGQEGEANIGWFGNLVNLLNNYVPEQSEAWDSIWGMIADGIGVIQRTSGWVPKDTNLPMPIPEFIGTPDTITPDTWIDNKDALILHQIFKYNKQDVELKLYRQDDMFFAEILVAPYDTLSNFLIGGTAIGKCLVDDYMAAKLNGLKIPVLVRGTNGLEYTYIHILLREKNGILDLSFSGCSSTEVSHLVSNVAYTVPCIINADIQLTQMGEDDNIWWNIAVYKKGRLSTYELEYTGRPPGPTPPPVPTGTLTTDNIESTILKKIVAREFIETSDDPKFPIGTGRYPLTYNNINTAIFDKVYARHFVAKDHEYPPTSETGNILYYTNLGDAVFDYLYATEFITTTDAPKPPVVTEAPDIKAPVIKDLTYSFYFDQGESCFSPTSNTGELPPDFRPEFPVAMHMQGYVFPEGKTTKSTVDTQLIWDREGVVTAYGEYSAVGNGQLDHVYDFTNRQWAICCSGDPKWYKNADRFMFRVYLEKGIIIYEFMARYSTNNLSSWEQGDWKLITEGEMPRNFYPTAHVAIQLGYGKYILILTNGSVVLHSDGSPVREGVVFNGCWINLIKVSDYKGIKNSLPSMADLVPLNDNYKSPLDRLKEEYDVYMWPTMNITLFNVSDDNGKLLTFEYELLNLRHPIIDNHGIQVLSDSDVNYMLMHKDDIRIHLGDGTVVRIHGVVADKITGYSGERNTGKYTFYMVLCEFLWAQGQTKWIIQNSEGIMNRLKGILIQWDGMSKTEYFSSIAQHLIDITKAMDLSANLTKQLEAEMSGKELADVATPREASALASLTM